MSFPLENSLFPLGVDHFARDGGNMRWGEEENDATNEFSEWDEEKMRKNEFSEGE